MTHAALKATLTIETDKDLLDEIDALACQGERSRSEVVELALRQYLDAHDWQVERIREGIAAARAGNVRDAEDVFAEIRAKYGW
ncbi:CopG family ribbon-helix-helix protein [Zavarzinia sp. CC-PAN008]|uniref:CopG family ribbon-helix-helix protein n=1 Tax=Zavarzinia sp. CC-PAN008 TaxID=3243332 RepID=UPI003F748D7C